ncbi:MAG: prepilin-type N-terminal cleavage/methylation domain-containing protein [Elusimicrobia bacterium]|nr:prepilin-type N-terminal cleavage/methylation domain-containing protein [Elusimicrobiota bacterium]
MKKIKKRLGFSLIEVIITIMIIAVLSMISGPIYRSYSDKAILTEGYALLGTIRSAQENYYNDTGTFLYYTNCSAGSIVGGNGTTCKEDVLGIDARHNKYYTTFTEAMWLGSHAGIDYRFQAVAFGKAAYQNLTMHYNITSGVTML